MILNNIYCQASGMVMQCINDLDLQDRLPIVVEIGCADGQGTARYAGFCEKVYCIDPMATGRPDIASYTKKNVESNTKKIADFWQNVSHTKENVQLIQKCSAWPDTIKELAKQLNGKMVDILLIDGCHHPFEAVWKDFELYYPFVDESGFIILDDLYESCIKKVWKKAQDEFGCVEHDRRSISTKFRKWNRVLQDVGALRVTKKTVV